MQIDREKEDKEIKGKFPAHKRMNQNGKRLIVFSIC